MRVSIDTVRSISSLPSFLLEVYICYIAGFFLHLCLGVESRYSRGSAAYILNRRSRNYKTMDDFNHFQFKQQLINNQILKWDIENNFIKNAIKPYLINCVEVILDALFMVKKTIWDWCGQMFRQPRWMKMKDDRLAYDIRIITAVVVKINMLFFWRGGCHLELLLLFGSFAWVVLLIYFGVFIFLSFFICLLIFSLLRLIFFWLSGFLK